MTLERLSVGVGDRFAHQGQAQLAALVAAAARGIEVVPVWNKSNREHVIIGTQPATVRAEAEAAVKALGWKKSFYVDADHISLKTVDIFMEASDFFTLDVADYTGKPAEAGDIDKFVARFKSYARKLDIPGMAAPLEVSLEHIRAAAAKYLFAVQEAGRIYRHVESKKGKGKFVTEVSMDETDLPQAPAELLFILAAISAEGIPAQTIAPKFTGRFNKGVDYVGNLAQFEKEFNEDLAVIAFAVKEFGLPANLKLSVHSGSDKFSIYGPINRALKKSGAGLHLKTAGTTWLEELIGLALSGKDGLALAREVYRTAFGRYDELRVPYAPVIDIDVKKLPAPDEVDKWSGAQYAAALKHDLSNKAYNLHFRQLLHISFKVASEMGERYRSALKANREIIAKNVVENLLERHILRVFG